MSSSFLTGLFLQLSISGSISQAAYLFTIGNGNPGFYPFIFLIYGPLMFLVNALFLRRKRQLSGLMAVNCPVGAAVLAASLLTCGHYSFWSVLASVMFVIFLTYNSVNLNMKEPTLRGTTLSVEFAVIVTIFFAALVSFMNANPIWIFPGAIGLACGMICLILKRIGRIPSLRDVALIAGILIIIFVLALLFVLFAAAPAGNGLIYLSSLIAQGAKQIWHFIELFFASISSSSKTDSAASMGTGTISQTLEFNSEEVLQDGPYGLIAIIVAAIIVVIIVIVIIRVFRRHRFVSAVRISRETAKGQRPTLKEAIKRLMAQLKLNRTKNKYLKTHADTPLGIYYSLEIKFRHGKNKKAAGETPREYILRLNSMYKSSDEYIPENNKLFEQLADMVDMEMYGTAEEITFPEAKHLTEIISHSCQISRPAK